MAFESLTDKLQNVFKNLRGKGRLTEEDVKTALKEVKMALLEADVNFRVVKQFVKSVEARAIGADVMNGLNPGQMVIKIVNEEMTALMGSETTEIAMQPGKSTTVIMMCGLHEEKSVGLAVIRMYGNKHGRMFIRGERNRCWLPVIFTGRPRLSSWKSTLRSRMWMLFPWEPKTSPWTLQRRAWSMHRKMEIM